MPEMVPNVHLFYIKEVWPCNIRVNLEYEYVSRLSLSLQYLDVKSFFCTSDSCQPMRAQKKCSLSQSKFRAYAGRAGTVQKSTLHRLAGPN